VVSCLLLKPLTWEEAAAAVVVTLGLVSPSHRSMTNLLTFDPGD
jgi:hypothetical protein